MNDKINNKTISTSSKFKVCGIKYDDDAKEIVCFTCRNTTEIIEIYTDVIIEQYKGNKKNDTTRKTIGD